MKANIMFLQDASHAAVWAQVGLCVSLAHFAIRIMSRSSGSRGGYPQYGAGKPAATVPPPGLAPIPEERDQACAREREHKLSICSVSARAWANAPPNRRAQKPKPVGDSTPWRKRSIYTDKNVNNIRKMLRHQLGLAFDEYDSLTVASTPEDTEYAVDHLRDTFKRLYFLDHLDMIIVKDKESGEDSFHEMTPSQVKRNQEFRLQELAPGIQSWKEGAVAVRKTHPWRNADGSRVPSAPPPPRPWLQAGDTGVELSSDEDHTPDEPPRLRRPIPTRVPPPQVMTPPSTPPPMNGPPPPPATQLSTFIPSPPPPPVIAKPLPEEPPTTPRTVAVIKPKQMPLYRWTEYPKDHNRKPTIRADRLVTPAGTAPPHAPMPSRPTPPMLFKAHEVHPGDETDWTQNADLGDEMKLRLVRNAMIKAMLL